MFSSIFGDLEEPEAWRGVAVRVDHDVPGAGDRQVLASLVAAWVAMCNIFYVSQNTWVAIRALEQLVPVLAHHHQVGHPDVAHLDKKKLDMYPTKLSVCQVNVVWFKLSLRVNLSVGLSAVGILVSRSSQEQVVALGVH